MLACPAVPSDGWSWNTAGGTSSATTLPKNRWTSLSEHVRKGGLQSLQGLWSVAAFDDDVHENLASC